MPADADPELLHFVERLALTVRDSGVPPMAARVLAYALAQDGERHTAGELAEVLQASPASISGAVRFLTQARLLTRVREPGQRSDLYTMHKDHAWMRILQQRLDTLGDYEAIFREGVEIFGVESAGGRRMAETADLFGFLRVELPKLLERWAQERDARLAAGGPLMATPGTGADRPA